jgi:hypothetical protein
MRSGKAFSPWAMGMTVRTIAPLAAADFDFERLVHKVVIREGELDDDDTEGCALDAATAPSSPHHPFVAMVKEGSVSNALDRTIHHLNSCYVEDFMTFSRFQTPHPRGHPSRSLCGSRDVRTDPPR